ncbi:MAG: type II toxin-antitoxin system RelE/ParE family toxin [Terracidiphilus sp.]
MSAERVLAYSGVMFKIAFARDRDGSNPAEEFFDQLPKADQAKLMNLFRILGDHGKHSNPEKFGDLGDGLFEFKSFQVRMPFAYAKGEKGLVLISHGFIKKSPKTPKAEIERARTILSEGSAASKVCAIDELKSKRRRP